MKSVDVVRHCLAVAVLAVSFVVACGSDPPKAKPANTLALKCQSDAECGEAKPHCDPLTGCVECLLTAQCEDGERCVDQECKLPTECSSSDDCSGSESVCNTISGECAGCVIDADCGEASVCLEGQCVEVTPCVNSRDCEEDRVCQRDLGYCVECVSDGDCDETTMCVENACVPRCDSDNDCKTWNLLCNHEVGYCVECVEHVDCPDVYHCRSGRCRVDTCLQGTQACDESFNATRICNDYGGATELVDCPYGTTCLNDNGLCTNWICTPGTARCSEDGQHLEVCDPNGLGYSVGTDCGEMEGVCQNAACVDVVCDPGELFCTNGVVYQCAAVGTSFTSIQTCVAGEFCEAGACVPQVCTPGSSTCDDGVVMTCNLEGSAYNSGQDCAESDSVCFAGACVPRACDEEDGTSYCREGVAYICENGGATERLLDTCLATEYCDPESALCRPKSCVPDAALCDGMVATTCNSLGSGPRSDGTDCAAEDNQVCFEGQCLPIVCEGARFCKDGNSYHCQNSGTASSTAQVCSLGQYCNTQSGYCQADVCVASTVGCFDSSTTGTCAEDGSGWIAGTACEEDETCVAGTCLPVVCAANTYYCDGQTIYRCGPDGTTTSAHTVCAANRYCSEGMSTCPLDVCTGGLPTCDGELLATCKADGSGPEDDGVACAEGQICSAGACADVVCTPNARFCEGGNVRTCNALGTVSSPYQTCSVATFCEEGVDSAICAPDICAAGEAACDGETLAVCTSDGGGYTSQTTDCSASDTVCNLTSCAAEAVDVIGGDATSSSGSNYSFANRFLVTSSRTLTEIEQYFSVTGTSQFTWFVYEGTGATGLYTKVFEQLTTSSGAGAFHSSGAIDVPLEAGKYYSIGVRVAGSAQGFRQSLGPSYHSFGVRLNGSLTLMSTALPATWSPSSSTTAFYQNLTTEAP